jgi:D-arabinose 1-dehydrogenase-like Zn-dependent alcohol dehydrogenase
MGADKVVAISRKMGKKEDSLKMGADLYIATEDETVETIKSKDRALTVAQSGSSSVAI